MNAFRLLLGFALGLAMTAPLQLLEPHEVRLVVGKRGCGKSHLVKEMLKEEIAAQRRVVVFDVHDEYSVHGRATDQVNLGPCRHRVELQQLLERPELLDFPRYSYAVQVRQRPEQAAADFEVLLELALETGDLELFADELGAIEEWCRPAINFVATQSRHAGVPLVLASQRMIHIPKTARTQATSVYSFLQNNPEDLAALEKLTGSADFAERVSRLPRRRYLKWRDDAPTPGASTKQQEAA